MERRTFLGLMATIWLPVTACTGEPKSGPVEIKWDRDTCARCSMVISDRNFAAQVRDASQKVHKFDDIGCAVVYLEQSSQKAAEFWVTTQQGSWIDAQKAHYLPGKRSPMGYGFAALEGASPDALDYEEVRRRILAFGR